jgi:hypothetical protein
MACRRPAAFERDGDSFDREKAKDVVNRVVQRPADDLISLRT